MDQGAVKMLAIVILLLAALVADGAVWHDPTDDTPKFVKCLDKNYMSCYNRKLDCSGPCSGFCVANCRYCLPECTNYIPPSMYKKATCRNGNFPECYGQKHVCPADCPTSCEVDCVTCKPVCSCDYPGAVCQDPRFIGGDGITFYFHGKKDADFTLVTDQDLHINAHFIGKRGPKMTRDFTWVESLGILYGPHRLFLGARKTVTWDDSIDRLSLLLDNQPIFLEETEGAMWRSGSLTVTRVASTTNSVTVEVEGKFKITAKAVPITRKESDIHGYGITDYDCFAHLDIGFRFYSLTDDVEGVLGKTYRGDYVSKINVGATMSVVGGEEEYQTSGLFATDCKAARFGAGEVVEGGRLSGQIESFMNCGSGMSGVGVVCKR